MVAPFVNTSPGKTIERLAGVVLLRSDGAALLQRRDNVSTIQDPGLWVFPGGHVDSEETAEDGAAREFVEETCYRCGALRPLIRFIGRELGYDEDLETIFFWEKYDGRQPIECREGTALRFVGRKQAESLPRRDYLTRVWDLGLAAARILLDR